MSASLASRLESLRRARGLTQRALAGAAGVTRQAVGAIESGRVQPSVSVALGLARALGTSVEELFGETDASTTRAFDDVAPEHLALEPSSSALSEVFIAGCDVSAGLLARHAMLRERSMRVLWLPMTNRAALDALHGGRVQAAVLHGVDGPSASNDCERFELATTEEGWLVARGNPLRLRGARDLAKRGVRLVNRPRGAGARQLLDTRLRAARIDAGSIDGYAREVSGQLDAGRAIAQGFADVAVGMASVAHIYGLDFIPLREERCVLVTRKQAARGADVRAVLETLRSQPYRRDLQRLNSYDVNDTGEPSV